MVTFSNLWNNLPDIRSLLPQKLGGRTPITAVEASQPEKLQSLRETLEPLTCGAAWQSDNNWSELTKNSKIT